MEAAHWLMPVSSKPVLREAWLVQLLEGNECNWHDQPTCAAQGGLSLCVYIETLDLYHECLCYMDRHRRNPPKLRLACLCVQWAFMNHRLDHRCCWYPCAGYA